jgi:DNA polymerase
MQIECRGNAWLAGQQDVLQVFATGGDVYSRTAAEIYGHDVDRKRKVVIDGVETYPDFEKGFVGKVATLGLGYQMGAPRASRARSRSASSGRRCSCRSAECQRIVRAWRRKNDKIVKLWNAMDDVLYNMLMKRVNGKRDDYTEFGVPHLRRADDLAAERPRAALPRPEGHLRRATAAW